MLQVCVCVCVCGEERERERERRRTRTMRQTTFIIDSLIVILYSGSHLETYASRPLERSCPRPSSGHPLTAL